LVIDDDDIRESIPQALELEGYKKDTFAKIPIILASAKGNHGDHRHAKLATEVLKKRLDLDELYAIVKKYCVT
jgi:hypothetical protein